MSFNFPPSPIPGQTFVAQGVIFTWSGEVWYVDDPFPWADIGDDDSTDTLLTPAAMDALFDTIGPVPPPAFPPPQDFRASRAAAVTYTNTTGRPLLVCLVIRMTVSGPLTYIVNVGPGPGIGPSMGNHTLAGNGWWGSQIFVVPVNGTYRLTLNAGQVIEQWIEYR